ncbi:MAG: hypothetical protein OXQ31_12640 [Spirochaetaceae bacterium]|nr:hypothetical protein [Spirochaetaceae bacterium]
MPSSSDRPGEPGAGTDVRSGAAARFLIKLLWLAVPAAVLAVFWLIDSNRVVNIDISVSPDRLPGNGFDRAQVHIRVSDTDGVPLPDHVLVLYVDGFGQMTRQRVKTDRNGAAEAEYAVYAVSRFKPPGVDTIRVADTSVGKVIGVFVEQSAEVTVEDAPRLSPEEVQKRISGATDAKASTENEED